MLYLIISAVIAAADQLTKYLTNANIELGGGFSLIPGVLSVTNVRNTGMAWSLLSAASFRWVLAGVSLAASVVIIVIILSARLPRWEKAALALILGGAVGNAIDRIVLGYVIDMIKTDFISFPVFNIADSAITAGAILFVILYTVRAVKEERAQRSLAMPELKRLKKSAEKAENDEENGSL